MNPTTSQQAMPGYATNPTYLSEPSNMQTGHAPLDTLPAAWWNWLWHNIIANNNGSYLSLGNVRDEIISVLQNAPTPITPSENSSTQLYQAINQIRQILATSAVPGAVKSDATDIKKVSVGIDGTMSVNALSDWSGTDTIAETIADAVEGEETARKAKDVQSVSTSLSNGTLTTTVTSTDGTTHSDTSATVSSVTASLSGSTLTISVNGIAGTVDLSSLAPSTVTRATYARFLVNSTTSTSQLVTADTSGNLKAHTLELS